MFYVYCSVVIHINSFLYEYSYMNMDHAKLHNWIKRGPISIPLYPVTVSILYRFRDIQRGIMACFSNLGYRLFKVTENDTILQIIYGFLVCHCKYSCNSHYFRVIWCRKISWRWSQVSATHPANLCTVCTSLKSTERGYLFAADNMGISSFNSIQRTSEKAM